MSTASSTYPKFESLINGTNGFGQFTVPAHTIEELDAVPVSNTVFPFVATFSNIFPSWAHIISSTTSGPVMTSATVANVYGTTQVFDYMKTQVRRNNTFPPPHNVGGGNLRPGQTSPYNWTFYNLSQGGVVNIMQFPGEDEVYVFIND